MPGRGAPSVEIDCASVSSDHWSVVIAPCLAHPLSAAQRSRFEEEGVLVVAIDMKSAREEALYDEGRHYDREDAFAMMQDPGFIGWLLSEPNDSVFWAVNVPLDVEIRRQISIHDKREREREKQRRLEQERKAEERRKQEALEKEARRKKFEQEAKAREAAKRLAEDEKARRDAEEEARRREESDKRAQRVSEAIEAEKAASERHGHLGLHIDRRGQREFAIGCPLYSEANIITQCGARVISTSHCHIACVCGITCSSARTPTLPDYLVVEIRALIPVLRCWHCLT